ncbi:MAG: inositol 2-dehydrogenase, partial [Chloroflexi bacterium]
MAKVGIGVIGLGRMGQVYGTHIARQVDGAALVAVADPQQAMRERFAALVDGVQMFTDYHDLLNHPQIAAVIIASSTHTHRAIVIDAAQAGKAIFCEKPLALTLKDTDDIITAVDRADIPLQVGFMRRFDQGYVAAKQKIEAGVIGQPVTIRSIGRDPFRTSLEFANPAVSGGIIVDMAIHDFDSIRWLMGDDVERVYTETASLVYPELRDVGDADNAMINLRFAGGGLGNVEVSRTAVYGYDIRCEVVGSQGTIEIGYLQETPIRVMTKEGITHDVVPHFPQRFGKAYTNQIEHFVDCLLHDRRPVVTTADARAA